jgi:hypothetical protein
LRIADFGLMIGRDELVEDGVFVPRNDGGTTGRWKEFLSREGWRK